MFSPEAAANILKTVQNLQNPKIPECLLMYKVVSNSQSSPAEQMEDDSTSETCQEPSIIPNQIQTPNSISNFVSPTVSDVNNQQFFNQILEKKIQDKEEFTEQEIYIILLLLQSRFNLPNICITVLAKFLKTLLKRFNISLNSSYITIVKKAGVKLPEVRKFFYTSCGVSQPVTDHNIPYSCDIPDCVTCTDPRTKMKKSFVPSKIINESSRFFCSLLVSDWIQFYIPLIFDKLRFDSSEDLFLDDIIDGSEYKRMKEHEKDVQNDNDDFESKTLHIILGYDGVTYVNDSSKSLWPIVGWLAELPPGIREEFPMLFACHAGNKKPGAIFKPLIDELLKYDRTPLVIDINGQKYRFYIRVLIIIADSPARAEILGCRQFNALYGCNLCKIRTYTLYNASRYPLTVNNAEKLDQEWRDILEKQKTQLDPKLTEEELLGVKNFPEVARLNYVDLVSVSPPESMHCTFIGVFKMFIFSWAGRYKKIAACFTQDNIQLINSRLNLLQFPSQQLRNLPRLNTNQSWKAFDYENFTLYGWPILEDILDKPKFDHFVKLIRITSLLHKRKISENELNTAEILSKEFILDMKTIYKNERLHRYVVHTVEHLPEVVRKFGPLNLISAFMVEDMMGKLVRKIQKSPNAAQQVVNKTIVECSVKALIRSGKIQFSNSFLKFSEIIMESRSENEDISITMPIVEPSPFSDIELEVLCNFRQDELSNSKCYSRMKIKNRIINTHGKASNLTTSNQYVKVKDDFVRISRIIELNCGKVVMLGWKYDVLCQPYDLYYAFKAKPIPSTLVTFSPEDIQDNFIFYGTYEFAYLFNIVNKHS